jgi:hypothetical protein
MRQDDMMTIEKRVEKRRLAASGGIMILPSRLVKDVRRCRRHWLAMTAMIVVVRSW